MSSMIRRHRLTRLTVRGFRSLRDVDLPLEAANALVGANGSGKSNLLGVFHLLSFLTTGRLQSFVKSRGGANSILHYGAKRTPEMTVRVTFSHEDAENVYEARLAATQGESLYFRDERVMYLRPGSPKSLDQSLGSGHSESLLQHAATQNRTASVTLALLRTCGVYQFHDTSHLAPIRLAVDREESEYLRTNGRNLAPFLLRLRSQHPEHYARIVSTIRLIAPFFDDFVLESSTESPNKLFLRWRDRDEEGDFTFAPNLLSDGTLRAMCLITLLLQPEEYMPDVLVVDEPELGLHPAATDVIGGLCKAASERGQIVLATQSPRLLAQFEPRDVVVAERHGGVSEFRRVSPQEYEAWLRDYTVAELWEKNVIGGGPAAWST